MTNATIGPAEFFAVQGTIQPVQNLFQDISESWEDGHGYAELGVKSKPSVLTCYSDFASALEAQHALIVYAQMKLSLWNIEIRVGSEWLQYFDYKVLDVEDVTELPFTPVASGGLANGKFPLVTRWTVQQVTGIFW